MSLCTPSLASWLVKSQAFFHLNVVSPIKSIVFVVYPSLIFLLQHPMLCFGGFSHYGVFALVSFCVLSLTEGKHRCDGPDLSLNPTRSLPLVMSVRASLLRDTHGICCISEHRTMFPPLIARVSVFETFTFRPAQHKMYRLDRTGASYDRGELESMA